MGAWRQFRIPLNTLRTAEEADLVTVDEDRSSIGNSVERDRQGGRVTNDLGIMRIVVRNDGEVNEAERRSSANSLIRSIATEQRSLHLGSHEDRAGAYADQDPAFRDVAPEIFFQTANP